jgi:hypothetical protein
MTLCLLVSWGSGCATTSQQQPQQAATGAVAGDKSASALNASGPPVAITARGAAIEDDLNGKFARAAASDQ